MLSIVIPVHNEEPSLLPLYDRLTAVLETVQKPYEILFVDDGRSYFETLLKINRYNFNWQLNYRLAEPRVLPAGTRLQWIGYFDNSPNNPTNPDSTAAVRFGEQSWEEMMIGFFDIAVDPKIGKPAFFERKR